MSAQVQCPKCRKEVADGTWCPACGDALHPERATELVSRQGEANAQLEANASAFENLAAEIPDTERRRLPVQSLPGDLGSDEALITMAAAMSGKYGLVVLTDRRLWFFWKTTFGGTAPGMRSTA